MSTGSSTLGTLLPQSVARWVGDATRSLPFVEPCRGAVMLADLSGFTPLAESLAAQGARGTEELTRLLNQILGAAADRIQRDGGELVKFAGDALLATWTDASLEVSAARAASCGLALYEVTAEAAAEVGAELRLSVGVGAGGFQLMVLAGSTEAREPDPSWRYRQETTREVAYELLLFSQRRQLHASVARAAGDGGGLRLRGTRLGMRGAAPAYGTRMDGASPRAAAPRAPCRGE